jgi:hypothetical protein
MEKDKEMTSIGVRKDTKKDFLLFVIRTNAKNADKAVKDLLSMAGEKLQGELNALKPSGERADAS